ncbi:MAG: hypothetical protein MUC57_02400 [Desulfobacterales bacterium]|nr:hypothetical protein [Desulfobacterales bacterium]
MTIRRKMIWLVTVVPLLLMTASCAMFDKGPAKPETAQKRLPDVREFDDVLIPREMDIAKESSMIYRREGMSAGLLRLSGRVEPASLMRYFQNNMANEGWRPISQFRSPQSLMIFQKGNRMAVIAIEDGDLETFADVWVVPMNETIDNLPPK